MIGEKLDTGLGEIDLLTGGLVTGQSFIIGSSMPINVRPFIYALTKKLCTNKKSVLFISTSASKVEASIYIGLDVNNSDYLKVIAKKETSSFWISLDYIYDELENKSGKYDFVIIDNICLLEEAKKGSSYAEFKRLAMYGMTRVVGVSKYDYPINLENRISKPRINELNGIYYSGLSQYVDYVLLLNDFNKYDRFDSKSLIKLDGEIIKVREKKKMDVRLDYKLKDVENSKILFKNAKALGLSDNDALTYAISWEEKLDG